MATIAVIQRRDGGYNLFGTDDVEFILQGNMTKQQLLELRKEIDKALKGVK